MEEGLLTQAKRDDSYEESCVAYELLIPFPVYAASHFVVDLGLATIAVAMLKSPLGALWKTGVGREQFPQHHVLS